MSQIEDTKTDKTADDGEKGKEKLSQDFDGFVEIDERKGTLEPGDKKPHEESGRNSEVLPADFEIDFVRYGEPEELSEEARSKRKILQMNLGEPMRIPPNFGKNGEMSKEEIRIILDTIFPPNEFIENEKYFIQKVSDVPETNEGLRVISNELMKFLEERMAQTDGICSIRSPIFLNLFSELIREECLGSPERGILLSRVKKEYGDLVDLYQDFIEGAEVYALRYSGGREDLDEVEVNLRSIRGQVDEMTRKVEELDGRLASREEELELVRNEKEKAQENDLEYHRTENVRLKKTLEVFIHLANSKAKYRRNPSVAYGIIGQRPHHRVPVPGHHVTIESNEDQDDEITGDTEPPSDDRSLMDKLDIMPDRIRSRSKSRKFAESISRLVEPPKMKQQFTKSKSTMD